MSMPTVGSIVHYRNRTGSPAPGQPEVAKVLFVHDDGYVNLEIFDAQGKQHVLRRAHWHDGPGEPVIEGALQVREMDMTERGWVSRATYPGTKEWAEPRPTGPIAG
jgi:hypothetical protein